MALQDDRQSGRSYPQYETNRFMRTPLSYPPDGASPYATRGWRDRPLMVFALGLSAGLLVFYVVHILIAH